MVRMVKLALVAAGVGFAWAWACTFVTIHSAVASVLASNSGHLATDTAQVRELIRSSPALPTEIPVRESSRDLPLVPPERDSTSSAPTHALASDPPVREPVITTIDGTHRVASPPRGETATAGHCAGDTSCPSGWRCMGGECRALAIAQATPCHADQECPRGQQCDEGLCALRDATTPSGATCVASSDCPANEKCLNGYCVVPQAAPNTQRGTACRDDTDCAGGQSCLDGACQFPNP